MTKRKSADEIGNTMRKKRQAFGAAKDRETKAKSKHNETESCFAKLPREVRRLIWTYVLGNEVLHVQLPGRLWECRLAVCGSARPSRLYRLSKTSENEAIPLSELAEKFIEKWNPDGDRHNPKGRGDTRHYRWSAFSHHHCLTYHLDDKDAQTEPNSWGENLAILRTCRMIYHEANNVLWTTNTFSFTEPEDFSTFMKHRTALQMQLLAKLHIVLRDCNADTLSKWQAQASHTVIKKLRSLKEVHFCLSQMFLDDAGERLLSTAWQTEYLKSEFAKIIGIFRICAPLRVATVIVENSYYSDPDGRLSHTQCLEWAEEFRNCLLDPDGPAKWQEDRDAELVLKAKWKATAREGRIWKVGVREGDICMFSLPEECARSRQNRQDIEDATDGPCTRYHLHVMSEDDQIAYENSMPKRTRRSPAQIALDKAAELDELKRMGQEQDILSSNL